MIKQRILIPIILFFTLTVFAIDRQESANARSVNTSSTGNVNDSTVAKRASTMALAPLDFLTVEELQDMQLSKVVLAFRRVLDNEDNTEKSNKPLNSLYSHIETAFMRARTKVTKTMDKVFYNFWKSFQKHRRVGKEDDESITELKQTFLKSIPAKLPSPQREQLVSVINNIETLAIDSTNDE
ncbi:hypothetical protein K501DRAFT_266088 [Backusella circina FSU 941]|nr:hypothetical protein K501DRAFT_266088 [Backusella circina FSU 941]